MRVIKSEIERETERDRERQRETERQRDRERQRQREIKIYLWGCFIPMQPNLEQISFAERE